MRDLREAARLAARAAPATPTSAISGGATTMLAKLSTELNQLAGTAPNGEARSTCWSIQTMPMFQIIV